MDASERRKRAGSEAADWFARLQAGEMERAEREQFVEWLSESHIHVAEMLRLAQIQGSLERFQHWARIATGPKTDADNVVQLPQDSPPRPPTPPFQTRRVGQGLRLFAFAATVLLIVGTLVVLPRIRGDVIETERGERREVVLADGSVLQVDAESRLRVKYEETVRRVFLDRGRALFHVAKNLNRPFLVKADGTTVRAVGTAFGVEQRAQGVIVTVAEGKVAVMAKSESTQEPSPPTRLDPQRKKPAEGTSEVLHPSAAVGEGARRSLKAPLSSTEERANPAQREGEVFLTANQQVMVQEGGSAEPVREVDSTRALAWAQGRLIFQNDELGQAVAEFNRYNRVQLTVTGPELAGKPVSGVFNAADPEAFIAFLRSVTPVEIVRDGDRSITIATARPR
jgi:transmembrane sensor